MPEDQTAFSCEDCKNLIVQFHLLKQNVKNSRLLEVENENIKKVSLFLDENEDEEISCLRYNKCLTLVPSSKRSFMETLKNWQPHVVLEKVMEVPARKRQKLDVSEDEEQPTYEQIKGELLETSSVVDKTDDFIEETLEAEAEEIIEVEQEEAMEAMTEGEWLEAAVRNSEFSEKDGVYDSWICSYCDQPEKFIDLVEFRDHLVNFHMHFYDPANFEQVVFDDSEDQTIQEYPSDDTIISVQQQLDLYHCPKCSFTCESRKEFGAHQKTHVSQKTQSATKVEKFCCIDCSYQFSAHSHYQAHLNGHQLFEIVSKHLTHPFCDECQMMFCEEAHLHLHQESHGTDQASEPIPAEGFFLKYGVQRTDFQTFETFTNKAVKCGHCTRTFDDNEGCRLHQMIFHVKTLRCPIEYREFNGNQAFSIHLKNNHPELFGNDIKFKCSVCKMEFESLYTKLSHMKTCDKKTFACTHCDKKFSQKCYLTMHLRRVTGQTSVTCEICEKVCRDKGDFAIHMRSHSNVKPFKCSICPKAYKTSSARAAHLETHMEKGFTCTFCKTLFNSRRTLTKHVKTKHYIDVTENRDGVIAVEVLADEVY